MMVITQEYFFQQLKFYLFLKIVYHLRPEKSLYPIMPYQNASPPLVFKIKF